MKVRTASLGALTAGRFVLYRGAAKTVGEAADDTSKRVARRAATSTGRNVGSMFGEAMPFIGTAVIVGVTALEVKDWCDLLNDLHAFEVAVDPSKKRSEEQATVCSLRVPTREELLVTVRDSPERVWTAAREHVPTLEDLRDVDWTSGWDWTKETTTGAWGATKGAAAGTWGATKDGAGAAKDAVGGVVDWLLGGE